MRVGLGGAARICVKAGQAFQAPKPLPIPLLTHVAAVTDAITALTNPQKPVSSAFAYAQARDLHFGTCPSVGGAARMQGVHDSQTGGRRTGRGGGGCLLLTARARLGGVLMPSVTAACPLTPAPLLDTDAGQPRGRGRQRRQCHHRCWEVRKRSERPRQAAVCRTQQCNTTCRLPAEAAGRAPICSPFLMMSCSLPMLLSHTGVRLVWAMRLNFTSVNAPGGVVGKALCAREHASSDVRSNRAAEGHAHALPLAAHLHALHG